MMLHSNTVRSPMANPGRMRHSKRKAVTDTPEGNERLSKRLSLLNIDNAGARVYASLPGSHENSPPSASYALAAAAAAAPPPPTTPALPVVLEEPQHQASVLTAITPGGPIATVSTPDMHTQPPSLRSRHRHGTAPTPAPVPADDDGMSLDDTKYKVYIHNIDDELADDEADEADHETTYEPVARDGSGKLVFLPVVDKHLRAAARDAAWSASLSPHARPTAAVAAVPPKLAVPRPIVPNKDGAIAGMQVVLYRDPTSLTVPPEQDRVRQAILDTRARYRQRLRSKDDELEVVDVTDGDGDVDVDVDADVDADALDDASMTSTPVPGTPFAAADDADVEPDGMDLD